MSFRYRLALFLVVTLVAVQALTAAFAYLYLRHNLVERAKRELVGEMGVFTRQLDFLSDRVTDAVKVASLDYALRAAIAQHNRDTELSALRNHGQRIGATRLMLVGLDGALEMDTAVSGKSASGFPFPQLLADAAAQDKAAGLAAINGRIYWIVAVPVRAPVPIGFIVACIPVNSALLDRVRALSAVPRSSVLAVRGANGAWNVAAQTGRLRSLRTLGLPPNISGMVSREVTQHEHHLLTVMARLDTLKGSAPVLAMLSYPLDEALAAYRSIVIPLLLLLTVALLVAVAGAMLIVRGVSRPVENLAAVARRIAGGDYTAPPRLAQRDEIGDLSDALINMTRSIAERESALRHAIDTAEIARSEAVRASEAKSQFLANMSHELRTPLNAIVGFGQMLEHQVLGPMAVPRYAEYAHDICSSGEQLLTMVQRMLDLADVERNSLELTRLPIYPAQLLQQSLIELRHFAEQNRVRLASAGNLDQALEGEGDPTRLRQAFTNLIHNGIKFTPAGGEVCVSGGAQSGQLFIRIADSGIGMPADMIASVVKPFHRLRSALDSQHQGAGLGLPFAKAVIELHGGQLELRSEVGTGTIAEIHLPIQAGTVSRAA
jgi:signal transduction histidine kinase